MFLTIKKDGETLSYEEKASFEINKSDFNLFMNEMTLHYCKVYQKGTLIRDFIPVETVDGQLALFDKCDSTFYMEETLKTAPSVKLVESGEFAQKVYYCESRDKYYTDTYCVQPIDVYDITYTGDYEGRYYGDVASFVAPVCPVTGKFYVFKINGMIWDLKTFPEEKIFSVTVETATSIEDYFTVMDGIRSDTRVFFDVDGSRYLTLEIEMCPLGEYVDYMDVTTVGSVADHYGTIIGLDCDSRYFLFYEGCYPGSSVMFQEYFDFTQWQKYKISFGYKNDNGTDVIFLSIKQGDNVLYYKQQSIEGRVTYIEEYGYENVLGAFGHDMILYSYKVYDNGVLIRDIVPVTDGAQNYYLFDECERKLFNVNNVTLTVETVDLGDPYGEVYYCKELSNYYLDKELTQRVDVYDITITGDVEDRYLGVKSGFKIPVCEDNDYFYIYSIDGNRWNGEPFVKDKFTFNVVRRLKAEWYYAITFTGDVEETFYGLDEDFVDFVLPKCADEGYYYVFTVDGERWDGQTLLSKNFTVNVKKVKFINKIEPDCVNSGHEAYYENNGSYYLDELCIQKIDDLETWLSTDGLFSELGHDYIATYTWEGEYCTAHYYCTRGCGMGEITEVKKQELTDIVEQSCVTCGQHGYMAIFENEVFENQIVSGCVEIYDGVLGHYDYDGDGICDRCGDDYVGFVRVPTLSGRSTSIGLKASKYLSVEFEAANFAPSDGVKHIGSIDGSWGFAEMRYGGFVFDIGTGENAVHLGRDVYYNYDVNKKFIISFGYMNDNGTDKVFLLVKYGGAQIYYEEKEVNMDEITLGDSDIALFQAIIQDITYCKIYDNGVPVRYLVPVQGENFEAYLLDQCKGGLYAISSASFHVEYYAVDFGEPYGKYFYFPVTEKYALWNNGVMYPLTRANILNITYTGDYEGSYLGYKESFALPVCEEEGYCYKFVLDGLPWCGKTFLRDKFTVTVLKLKAFDKIEPTCTENGQKAYYEYNGEYYSDENCTTKIDDLTLWKATDGLIDPLGHDYEITYVWNGTSCTATAVCKRDNSHKVVEVVTGVYVKDSEKTCENPEKGHYKATFTNGLFSEQVTATNSVENGDPLGHNFDNYVSDGNATCEHDGTKTSKCSRCEVTNTIIDEGTKLGHNFDNYVSDGNATCEHD
ncbi:MAG: hypothetical protein MJ072_00550, partial [Clostridia bacterium]|nr:hypothetical protein [Clostridia bacterium]